MNLKFIFTLALTSLAMVSCTDNTSRAIEIVNHAALEVSNAPDSASAQEIVGQTQKDVDALHLTADQQRSLASDPAYIQATTALTKAAADKGLPI